MPNTSGGIKKNSSPSVKTNSPQRVKNRGINSSNNNNKSASSENSTGSPVCSNGNKARKRKRREILKSSESELESELENCNLEDAIALEKKLRKVAKTNSLNDDEMKKLLQKFVKNEHVLALVTLKAEDELARERKESEQRAILITDTPSVPKLTRAKARELNKAPAITIPAINDASQTEIASLIKEDLHSDDDDEEYIFKEEDFASDDDPNTTISDFDSNPCTPQTPLNQTDYEDSPVKLTADGCFKIPLDKYNQTQENMRIAARTRSKLCLQETTIEDIQSEFVPPDIDLNEMHDTELGANDEEWMEFLNAFSKPLNNSILNDDDDPINDPEYIAADKEHVDAEELRNVNISKKELTELVSELFEGLVNEGVSLESIDLETPQKFLQTNSSVNTPTSQTVMPMNNATGLTDVTRQINFSENPLQPTQSCVSDATISSTNLAQSDFSFVPNIMSTPSLMSNCEMNQELTLIPVAVDSKISNEAICKTISIPNATTAPELIAVPVPGHPNHFHIARIVSSENELNDKSVVRQSQIEETPKKSADVKTRYAVPYDNNFTWHYISIKRHVYSEYMDKFESLRNIQNTSNGDSQKICNEPTGFTNYQHDLLQQQLRIHVQMITQTYLQTYSHPEFWKLAPQTRKMLDELHEKSVTHATFNAWNLKGAIDFVNNWEQELSKDTQENKEMMAFIHKEVGMTNKNTRQVPRFAPRIMEVILNSNVFMYPKYLPRIPFTPKVYSFQIFAPSESQLIALGLEKHMRRLKESGEQISKKHSPLIVACKNMSKDVVFGKSKRRIWNEIKKLRQTSYYNPVKYYFEHNRAPPVEHELLTFENNTVLPPIQRYEELPLAWQYYIQEKNNTKKRINKHIEKRNKRETTKENSAYLDIVREAIGENIQLPDTVLEAAVPAASATPNDAVAVRMRKKPLKRLQRNRNSVTINVNYVFGANVSSSSDQVDLNSLLNSSAPNPTSVTVNPQIFPAVELPVISDVREVSEEVTQYQYESITTQASNIIAYNYDYNLQQLEPVIVESLQLDKLPSPPKQICEKATESPASTKAKTLRPLKPSYMCSYRRHWRHSYNHLTRFGVARRRHCAALKYRRKRVLKKHFLQLLTAYRQNLHAQVLCYQHSAVVLHHYKYFKALELYTEFLCDLKMFCRNNSNNSSQMACQNKRLRSDEDGGNSGTTRSRKINRQEENLRNMLLPDSAEDANRKDAIYAFNFYEKVEEILKSNNRLDDYEKFNCILKTFDPKCDRVADLYYKLESLFLPDYPELAHVFLTFLLPSEAAEIGKFFEHFMITNMTTFINKLNVYFNKQPAQIRKIYNCLSELAEDTDVTMKKVEEKILPLLKGNQFLIDWFMQQFPEAPVPERLLRSAEHVNLKEVQSNSCGEFMETVKDILDSPTSEQVPQCQLRYINGRIFYGSKMTLPAKLSFMAAKFVKEENSLTSDNTGSISTGCMHAIRDYGEKRLGEATASALPSSNANNLSITNAEGISEEIIEKSEEDDLSKALIIDTTCVEEDSCSSIEGCDDATLRAHALRLNPSYYSNTCFPAITATSTPNVGSTHQVHHPNAKKQSLNFYDDIKISPRKMSGTPLLPSEGGSVSTSSTTATIRDKRKSPTKKIKSPNIQSKLRAVPGISHIQQPMVVIPRDNNSGAIVFAKKLKSLIESGDEQLMQQDSNRPHVPIIARVKQRPQPTVTIEQSSRISDDCNSHFVGKYENSEEMEFLPEHTPPQENKDFPKLHLEVDSSTDEDNIKKTEENIEKTTNAAVSTVTYYVDSDEDCKLDVVATLATTTTTNESQREDCITATSTTKTVGTASVPKTTKATPQLAIKSNAFTREEDKVFLIEMKMGSVDRNDLLSRIGFKLPRRTQSEISTRHQFLMDFLSKLQGKQ